MSRWAQEFERASLERQLLGPATPFQALLNRILPRRRDGRPRGGLSPAWVFFGLIACGSAAIAAYELFSRAWAHTAAAAGAQTGTASIDSRPAGALVRVDGVSRGVTPLKITLPLGGHMLELRSGSEVRTVPLTIEAGTTVSQHVELLPAPPPPLMSGMVEVSSDPAGAEVRMDGGLKGKTPLTLTNVQSGEHTVVVGKGNAAVTRRIRVASGATASVVVSPKPEGVSAGWIAFKTPLELKVFEGGKMIGTTSADRLMIPSGRHDLELVNEPTGFRAAISVQVASGQVAEAAIKIPNGSLSVNALPWAEVLVDGSPVGVTPLANLSLPIGAHEIVWKHPELGERRQTVTVSASTPARVGMDFTR